MSQLHFYFVAPKSRSSFVANFRYIVYDCSSSIGQRKKNIIYEIEYDNFAFNLFKYNQKAIINVCSSDLETVKVPKKIDFKGTTYEISSIGNYAFSKCKSLKFLFLSKDLIYIDSDAFSGAKSLTDIYFDGTKMEWNEIMSRTEYNYFYNHIVIHCKDGEIYILERLIFNS